MSRLSAEQVKINNFLAGLSPAGLIYARSRIRDHIGNNGITQLPPEIILHISEHLKTDDVLNVWRVSKAWRLMWQDNLISSAICQRMFPGYLEYHAHLAAGPATLLLQAIKETRKVWPKQGDINTQTLKNERRYWRIEYINQRLGSFDVRDSKVNQGKFAWSSSDPSPAIHVHDLASGHVQHIGFGGATLAGEMVELCEISSKLVVAQQKPMPGLGGPGAAARMV
jgi:hypothetical protein